MHPARKTHRLGAILRVPVNERSKIRRDSETGSDNVRHLRSLREAKLVVRTSRVRDVGDRSCGTQKIKFHRFRYKNDGSEAGDAPASAQATTAPKIRAKRMVLILRQLSGCPFSVFWVQSNLMDFRGRLGNDTPPSQLFSQGLPHDSRLVDRVVLNVGGTRFETFTTTLTSHPETLLGAMFSDSCRGLTKADAKGEYFFDRCVVRDTQLVSVRFPARIVRWRRFRQLYAIFRSDC